MRKNKCEWLDRTPIHYPWIVLCLNKADYDAKFKELDVPINQKYKFNKIYHGRTDFYNDSRYGLCAFVCLSNDLQNSSKSNDLEVASVLCHEAVHVFQFYMVEIGEDTPSTEFEAYGVQTIFRDLMYSYRKQKGTREN